MFYNTESWNESLGECDAKITCSCGKVFSGRVKDNQRYKCSCGKIYICHWVGMIISESVKVSDK